MTKVEIQMTTAQCWCGTPFSLPTRLYDVATRDGTEFFCPLGHSNVFKEPEADKQRRRAERAEQIVARKDDELRELEGRRRATLAQVAKLKKRASAGMCPACRRTFPNMARHMKHQHPGFVENGAKVVPLKTA